ncbi:MAG: SAM-dependent methyltransferase, partial [Sphingomonadaceae bacterium]|nr:SAM-dependent methyltransferase [Sphingomonadaceae bacterium]
VRDRAVAELAQAQGAMLARAADWVRPGGRLVYAVCSLEPEEGERVVEGLLAARPEFAIDPVTADDLPAGIAPTQAGCIRILPGMIADRGGADGFFIARLARA